MRRVWRSDRRPLMALAVALAVWSSSGCGAGGSVAAAGDGTGSITVWAHQGQPAEVAALQAAVAGFNASRTNIRATLTLVPEADYPKTVAAAQVADLPDVLEFDGPTLASLVYNRKVGPIDGFVSAATRANATKAILAQGTINGHLYGIGQFDSGLGVWGNRRLLAAAGISIPPGTAPAWTDAQFTADLAALARHDPDHKVLDLKENYGFGGGSEWTTFGFLPAVWSAGGNAMAHGRADGAINTPAAVRALTTIQGWKKYVDPDTDDDAFTSGKVALSWAGHWVYPGYAKALGDDLVLLPLPDFGLGVKTGQGSWAWGVSTRTRHGLAAGAFLDYLMADANVTAMTAANGAPPGTRSGLAHSDLYRPGGRLYLYAEQLDRSCGQGPVTPACVAVPRPVTAGYPVVTRQFAQAFKDIYDGADPRACLDRAAHAIDTDFADNDGYLIS